MPSPKLLLSTIDSSDSSLSALNVAEDIAKQCGATILLLHAMPVVPKPTKDLSVLSGWRRFAFGSVAEKVVRTGPCSVPVVRGVTTPDAKTAWTWQQAVPKTAGPEKKNRAKMLNPPALESEPATISAPPVGTAIAIDSVAM